MVGVVEVGWWVWWVMGGWWVIGGWWWVAGRRVGVLGGVMGLVLGAGWCWGELDQVGWCLLFRV